jgi:hypothetical protein
MFTFIILFFESFVCLIQRIVIDVIKVIVFNLNTKRYYKIKDNIDVLTVENPVHVIGWIK